MKKLDVYFSPLADFKIRLICDYLVEEWSEKSKQKFLSKLVEVCEQLSAFPLSSPESQYISGVRKAKIEKHNSLFYRLSNEVIEVITAMDNRQNPDLIEAELKKNMS